MEELFADLVVIGSGPAGQKAAIQAAKLGKSVVIIEKYLLNFLLLLSHICNYIKKRYAFKLDDYDKIRNSTTIYIYTYIL